LPKSKAEHLCVAKVFLPVPGKSENKKSLDETSSRLNINRRENFPDRS
jgi:hypothetical protein